MLPLLIEYISKFSKKISDFRVQSAVNCLIQTEISTETTAPHSPIRILHKDKPFGLIFSVGGSKIPEILRWVNSNGGKNTTISIADGETTHRASVEGGVNPVTFQIIKQKIPPEVDKALKELGWDAIRVYEAVKKAREEGGELKPDPIDPF